MRFRKAALMAVGLAAAAWAVKRISGIGRSTEGNDVSSATNLRAIQTTYGRYAPWYDVAVCAMSLGQERFLRQAMMRVLRPAPGATVLDVACGTGANFPLLEEAIGPSGRIIGLDYTDGMLAQARERVRREGWQNVTLVRGDAATLELDERVDAVLCTLAIGLIPERKEALRRMVSVTKPGGRILIADVKLITGALSSLVNLLMKSVGRPWLPATTSGPYWTVRPWEELRELLGEIEYGELFGGAVYYATGTVN